MAQENAGRPLHSAGTDGWHSPAPANRSNQSHTSPSRERRGTNTTYKNSDGTEFPRYFLQLGQDIKRTRGYEMIQELQLMVCNKETGIKGNAARARVMVLLREVQGVLVGLENKVDAQTYDLGVFNVERSELRKELRDQKAKEFQPLHTVDFRSTEVKDLPHKLRTLFEDNQILREQVRQLQYTVRSTEARLEASERRAVALESENMQLGIALREAGSSVDLAHDMRQMREAARGAEARAMQLEMQLMSVSEQLEAERRLAVQRARHSAAKQAMLEARLTQALSPATAAAPPPRSSGAAGVVRRSSARPAVYDPIGLGMMSMGLMGLDDGGSITGRVGGETGHGSGYGGGSVLDGGVGAGGGGGPGCGGGGGGGGAGGAAGDGRSSAHSRVHSTASGGGGGAAGRSSTGRERSTSPPRSPSGRSISHSPGSGIPTLYPLFNAKPRPIHAFAPDSATWLSGTTPAGVAGGSGTSGAGPSGLPPPPSMVRNASFTERSPSGPLRRPSSGSAAHGSSAAAAGTTLEMLPDGRTLSSSSTSLSSPGEVVRAINSSATLTSRTMLPSVIGATGGAGAGSTAGRSSTAAGQGILALRVEALAGGGGGMGSLRRSTGSDDLSLSGPISARSRGGGGGSSGDGEAGAQDLSARSAATSGVGGSSFTAGGDESVRAGGSGGGGREVGSAAAAAAADEGW